MIKITKWAVIIYLMLGICFFSPDAAGQGEMTQAEWASYLARGTGLEDNLPAPLLASDYISILSERSYRRVEAEDLRDISPHLNLYSGSQFGTFSGKAWIQSGNRPGSLIYRFESPIKRRYDLFARVRGNNQFWKLNRRKRILVTPENNFSRVKVGEFNLEAGRHLLKISLPPDSGVDLFEMITHNAPPIEPLGGFSPLSQLTYGEKAATLIRALNREDHLPIAGGNSGFFEAEDYARLNGVVETKKSMEHGTSSGHRWIYTSSGKATVTYWVTVPEDGIYTIRGRFSGRGNNILSIDLDGDKVYFAPLPGKEFNWVNIFTGSLSTGRHRLDLALLPGHTADVFQWIQRRATAPDYCLLLPPLGFKELEFPYQPADQESRSYQPFLRGEGEDTLPVSGRAVPSRDRQFGDPSGEEWLQPLSEEVVRRFEINIPEPDKEKSSKKGRPAGKKLQGEKSDWITGSYQLSDSIVPGSSSGDKWLSARGTVEAHYRFNLPHEQRVSFYCRTFGSKPLNWKLNPERKPPLLRKQLRPISKDKFTWQKIGEVTLPRGEHILAVAMPKDSGLDLCEIRKGDPCLNNRFALYSRDRGGNHFTWTIDPDLAPSLLQVISFPSRGDRFEWHEVSTLDIPPGKHLVEVRMEEDGGLDAWELRRRNLDDCQMADLAKQLVSRDAALDNLAQLKDRMIPPPLELKAIERIPAEEKEKEPLEPDDVNPDDISPVSPFKP